MQHVDFNYVSAKAAKLENEKRFNEAQCIWLLASDLAVRLWNKEWCVNRAHYCAKRTLN